MTEFYKVETTVGNLKVGDRFNSMDGPARVIELRDHSLQGRDATAIIYEEKKSRQRVMILDNDITMTVRRMA